MLWDHELQDNLYLCLQFVERKITNKNPTITNVITRKLIEDEYDLLGYTVF